jgi:hypothetical protein
MKLKIFVDIYFFQMKLSVSFRISSYVIMLVKTLPQSNPVEGKFNYCISHPISRFSLFCSLFPFPSHGVMLLSAQEAKKCVV